MVDDRSLRRASRSSSAPESESVKFRTEAFSVHARARPADVSRGRSSACCSTSVARPNPTADRLGTRLIAVGIVAGGDRDRRASCCSPPTPRSTPASRRPSSAMRIVWFLGFTAVMIVGARQHQVRQLDLRRRRQQGGVPPGRCAGRPHQDAAVHAGRRAPPGWSACCSPSASTRSRRTPATVRSSSTSSPPSSAARCSPAATARRSAARSVP